MSFHCPSCNKVHKLGRMVVMSTHEVKQYDHYHKREVVTNEIKCEVRMCEPCAIEIEETPLSEALGLVRDENTPEVNSWLVEAIEQNAPEGEFDA